MSASNKISKTENELGEESEVIIIPPNDELKNKAIIDGSSANAYNRAIKAAEEAIEQLSSEFGSWINMELERLLETVALIRKEGWNEELKDQLFTITHDLKGQATTLGYPTITEICDTLCNLIENMHRIERLSLNVVEIFVTSIKTIIDQCERNQENHKATAISLGLRQMAIKILQQENETHNQSIAASEETETMENAPSDIDISEQDAPEMEISAIEPTASDDISFDENEDLSSDEVAEEKSEAV